MFPGSALSFNDRGVLYTQNSLFPSSSRQSGLASNFVNRMACGQDSMEGVQQVLATKGQTLGYSLNVVAPTIGGKGDRDVANFEVFEDELSRYSLPPSATSSVPSTSNYSHFNMYKRLRVPQRQEASTLHRQARVDALPPVRTANDILHRLGDTEDANYPIYRNITLMTSLITITTPTTTTASGTSNAAGKTTSTVVRVWCLSNPSSTPPCYEWDLASFWNADAS